MLLGLLHASLYIYIVPPWQHYDEPGQFEYAWLFAHHPGTPQRGEVDQAMRREVAASMVEHGFFSGMGGAPSLLSLREPIWIGISQVGDRPLYYWLESLPLRLIPYADVFTQLLAARWVSGLLFLVSLLAAWGSVREITSPGSPLRWMVPLSMALLPGFVDIMTAVNNDVGATAVASLFFWASLRILKRGFTLRRLGAILGTAALAILTKNTIYGIIPMTLVVILFSLFPGKREKWAWGIVGVVFLAVLGVVFSWGDAASWHRESPQAAPARLKMAAAPLGESVLHLDLQSGYTPRLAQIIPIPQVRELAGGVVTFGGWMWASRETRVYSPILTALDGRFSAGQMVDVGIAPTFHTFTTTLPADTVRAWIKLAPLGKAPDEPLDVYYDGLVLLEGSWPAVEDAPVFEDAGARRVRWQGTTLDNYLVNASGERGWFYVQGWVDRQIQRILPGQASVVLSSLFDLGNTGWYYQMTFRNLLVTFWAKFGWGHVRLDKNVYLALAAFSGLGILGAVLGIWQRRKGLIWPIVFLLGSALLAVWWLAVMRGVSSVLGVPFIPAARYAYPVIFPTMLLLNLGWLEAGRLAARGLRLAGFRIPESPAQVSGSPAQVSGSPAQVSGSPAQTEDISQAEIFPARKVDYAQSSGIWLGLIFLLLFLAFDLLAILQIIRFYAPT